MKKIFFKLSMAIIFVVVLFAGNISKVYAKTIDYNEALSKMESEGAISLEYKSLSYQVISKNLDVLVISSDENKLQGIADQYDDITSIIIEDGTIKFISDGTTVKSIDVSISYADADGNIKTESYKSEYAEGAENTYIENKKGTITFADAAWKYYNWKLNNPDTNATNIVLKYSDDKKSVNKSSLVYTTNSNALSFKESESKLADFDGATVDLTMDDIMTVNAPGERRKKLVYSRSNRILFC